MCYGGCDCKRCNPPDNVSEPIQMAVLIERGLYEQTIARLEDSMRERIAKELALRDTLATAQAERDAARSAAREIITKLEAERDAANAERQRAVDSLAKYIERVRELEGQVISINSECEGHIRKWQQDRRDLMQNLPGYQYRNRVDDHEWRVAKRLILALQATLAARVRELEDALQHAREDF